MKYQQYGKPPDQGSCQRNAVSGKGLLRSFLESFLRWGGLGKAASHDSDQVYNETPRMASASERWAAPGLKAVETLGIGP